MRPPDLVYCLRVVELDVQVLIHALQCASDLDFVLELHGDLVLDERLEETTNWSALLPLEAGYESLRRSAMKLWLEGVRKGLRT